MVLLHIKNNGSLLVSMVPSSTFNIQATNVYWKALWRTKKSFYTQWLLLMNPSRMFKTHVITLHWANSSLLWKKIIKIFFTLKMVILRTVHLKIIWRTKNVSSTFCSINVLSWHYTSSIKNL